MTRVEGLAWTILIALIGVASLRLAQTKFRKRTSFKLIVLFLLTFFVCSIPFWVWIRLMTGTWKIIWYEGSGLIGTYLEQRKNYRLYFPDHVGAFKTYHAFKLVQFYLRGLFQVNDLMIRIFPLVGWIFIAFGMVSVLLCNRGKIPAILLTMVFACFPILFYPLVCVSERLLHPSVLFLIMFSGVGINSLSKSLSNVLGGRHDNMGSLVRKESLLIFLILAFLTLFLIRGDRSLLYDLKNQPLEQKVIGQWIQSHYTEPKVILDPDIRSCYYAGPSCKKYFSLVRTILLMKEGVKFEEILKKNEIQLINLCTLNSWYHHPLLDFLLTAPPPYLHKRYELSVRGGQAVLYEVDRVKLATYIEDHG